jgi:hypothetical protein
MSATEGHIRSGADWRPGGGDYEDIRYELADGIAKITIDRPEVRNAFRPETLIEMSEALERAREDTEVGVIVLTGEGPLAFCSGGDQRVRGDTGYVAGGAQVGRFHVTDLHVQMRRLPKPIVAMVAGYAIGALLYEVIGKPILAFYNAEASFERLSDWYNIWGGWGVLFAAVTPFPYKVLTIFSGATGLSIPVFIAVSIIGRGLRFFLVSALLYWFGEPIRGFIEKNLGLLFTLFMVLLIGGFVAVRYIF